MKTTNNNSKKRGLLAIALVSILFLFSSCTGTNPPTANEVFIQSMAFSPVTLTVTAGTSVKWTNKDAVAHTVTSDTGLFDSGNLSTNGTYSHTFTTAGTYNNHCTYHSSMTAKIIVN